MWHDQEKLLWCQKYFIWVIDKKDLNVLQCLANYAKNSSSLQRDVKLWWGLDQKCSSIKKLDK